MNFHFNRHLTIGFAGKRQHNQLTIIDDKLPVLLAAIHRRQPAASLRFTSGLADGADQIAAKAFLRFAAGEQGLSNYKLGAVLPFAQPDYRHTIVDLASFDALYGQCDQQLELDGRYMGGETVQALNAHNRAYQQQGTMLGYTADLMLAVAPYDDPEKTGGTIETIITALGLKKPVILLDLNDGEFYLFETLEDWFQRPASLSAEMIMSKLFPVDATAAEVPSDQVPHTLIYQLRKRSWQLFERVFKGRRPLTTWTPVTAQHPLHGLLLDAQRDLDDKARYFQYQYRGGYVLNYLLALTAIFLAVGSAVCLLLEKKFLGTEPVHYALLFVGMLKLAILIIIYRNTKNINHNQYNKRAIDYRYAAERLRANTFLSIIGILRAPNPSLGNHSKKFFAQYTGEAIYQRHMEKALDQSYQIIITQDALEKSLDFYRKEWIKEQHQYHERESGRTAKMEKRLEKIPEFLSKWVIRIVIADLVLGMILILSHEHHSGLTDAVDFLIPFLLGLTAFIPAVITTLNSVNAQSDAHRLLLRAELMLQELTEQRHKIDETQTKIRTNAGGCNFHSVLKTASETANLLTDEVAEWSLIYEKQLAEL